VSFPLIPDSTCQTLAKGYVPERREGEMIWILIGVGVVLAMLFLIGVVPILLRPKGQSVAEGQRTFNELMEMSREERDPKARRTNPK
jgi:hypothetical protein